MWVAVVVVCAGVLLWAAAVAFLDRFVGSPRPERPRRHAPPAPRAASAAIPERPVAVGPRATLSEVSGTLMSAEPLGSTAVLLEVLAVSGSGEFAQLRPGELVKVLAGASELSEGRAAGVEVLGEVSVRVSASPVPGELFSERRVHLLPVTTAGR